MPVSPDEHIKKLQLLSWNRCQTRKSVVDSAPPITLEFSHRASFHLAEFTALKTEVGENVRFVWRNMQYAVALSSGIAAWLLSPNHVSPIGSAAAEFRAAWWLPLVVSLVLGLMAMATYIRIGAIAQYLVKLETGFRFQGLGWERAFRRRIRSIGAIYFFTWLLLIAGDLYLVLFLRGPVESLICV